MSAADQQVDFAARERARALPLVVAQNGECLLRFRLAGELMQPVVGDHGHPKWIAPHVRRVEQGRRRHCDGKGEA
jgi:hypothetical protein